MRSIANIAISLKRLVTTGMPERLRISASTNSSLALLTANSSWVSFVVARKRQKLVQPTDQLMLFASELYEKFVV